MNAAAAEVLRERIVLTEAMIGVGARIVAAKLDRTGSCEQRDLVEIGFNVEFVAANFAIMKWRGEQLLRRPPPRFARVAGG